MFACSRLIVLAALCLTSAASVFAQQRGSISGKVLDTSGLALPGATVTVHDDNTGFIRTVVTAANGAYTVTNLDPGVYTLTVEIAGFAPLKRPSLTLAAGAELVIDARLQLAGVQEEVVVTAEAPLVDRTSNKIGGTLSSQEIDDVPANFRHIGALTQLVPGMTPNPAASTFEGGQVVANGVPAQSNVYLLDGMYNNDDRLGGSQGTQVRVVLDNIAEYQVLSNQYSTEYGGGAGAIINMVTRGGTNSFSGRAYTYFRDDKFYARRGLVPTDSPKPDERTLQAGFALGGPIVRDRAHFYFTIEKDNEDIAGFKPFPAEAAPLAVDFVGAFEVRAMNYFGRGDVQINDNNFVNARWILETAPTKGEDFNTSTETIDAQGWEDDWDHLFSVAFTSVLSDRATNVIRVGRIGEQLNSGAQTYFDDNVNGIGFDGRDPFSIGQSNTHPDYTTGKGGSGTFTTIRTYTFDESFSYFVPSLWGREHTIKAGGGLSFNQAVPRKFYDTGTFDFGTNLPYDPANPATYPREFVVSVVPDGQDGAPIRTKDRRYYFFLEDRVRVSDNLTLNLGLRYDHQKITPASKDDVAPRVGFAWDITGAGTTVVRGGFGRFYAYAPVSVDLNAQQRGLFTLSPEISIFPGTDTCNCVLRPDVIADSQGNLGVATLSAAGIADIRRRRDAILAGTSFNRDPRLDSPLRQLPYQWAWSVGVSQQLFQNAAFTIDYVGNAARDQMGYRDYNEPVNGVRPGIDAFDPNGILIPASARGANLRRVWVTETGSGWNSDYKSLQVSVVKRMSNRWSGRMAYTLQKSNYVGLGNPDSRRVWLDNDLRADYGRFASDRRHVLAMSGIFNVWQNLTIATLLSTISGSPYNETIGRDANGDNESNNDRPIQGIDDLVMPIRSKVDSQGRAVINGLDGPGSFLLDVSFRYSIPIARGLDSLDLFYDIFNLTNRVNLVPPTGNRRSSNFGVSTGAQFPRQMQFGVRVRF